MSMQVIFTIYSRFARQINYILVGISDETTILKDIPNCTDYFPIHLYTYDSQTIHVDYINSFLCSCILQRNSRVQQVMA